MLRTKLQKKYESSNSETLFFDNLFAIAVLRYNRVVRRLLFYALSSCYVIAL